MLFKTRDFKNSHGTIMRTWLYKYSSYFSFMKFCNIHKKTAVLKSLFNKVAMKFFIEKKLRHRYFPVSIAKTLRKAFVIKQRWQFFT